MFKDRRFWILLLLSLLLLVLPNGLYYAFDKDEPKYLEAAWEMVKSGDYITPYYNYQLRFDKPILIYWLIALGYKLFGVNEFGGRFFPSLCGVLTVLLLYWWVKRFKGEELAFTSSLVLLTSLDFIVMSSVAMPDIVLTTFISGALMFFFLGYKEKKKSYYNLAFLLSGLATLTKGPVGLVLPGLIAVIFLILHRSLMKTLKEIPWISGLGLYLLVVLPWYGAIFLKHGREFFMDFIVFHNIHRFTGKIPGHPTQWWYYLVNYFWLYFPWSLVFPFALRKLLKEKEVITEELLNFAVVWFFTVFAFFQTAHTKLAHYLLPSFPAFSVITAWYIQRYRERAPYALTAVLAFLVGALGVAFWHYKGWPLVGALFLIPPLLGALLSLYRVEYKSLAYGFLVGMLFFKWITLPSLQPLRSKEAIAKEVKEFKVKCKNLKVVFFDYTSPEIVYAYRLGQIKDLGKEEVLKLLKGKEPVVVITRENRLKKLKGIEFKVIDRKRELLTNHSLVLISNKEIKNGC